MNHKYLVLVPLKKEFQLLQEKLIELGSSFETQNLGRMSFLLNSKLGFFLAISGHGKTLSATRTQFLLDHLPQIKIVLCVGSAGALIPEIKVGDIVVGQSTIEHDWKSHYQEKMKPQFEAPSNLLKLAADIQALNCKIFVGPIASGDEDITSTQKALELYKKTKALAVAWEGAGIACSAKFMNISFLEVRAITDQANELTPATYLDNLPKSMHHLAQFLTQFFMGLADQHNFVLY